MVALTRLLGCIREDKQAADGDANVSLKLMEPSLMGGHLSLSFWALDGTLSSVFMVLFLKEMCLIFEILSAYPDRLFNQPITDGGVSETVSENNSHYLRSSIWWHGSDTLHL